jgi:hypothetical protein
MFRASLVYPQEALHEHSLGGCSVRHIGFSIHVILQYDIRCLIFIHTIVPLNCLGLHPLASSTECPVNTETNVAHATPTQTVFV